MLSYTSVYMLMQVLWNHMLYALQHTAVLDQFTPGENLVSHDLWLTLDLLSKDSQNLIVQVSIYWQVQNIIVPKLLSIRNLEKKGILSNFQ